MIAVLCTGEFIVSYRRGDPTVQTTEYVRRYQANGVPKGSTITVGTNVGQLGGEALIYKPTGFFAVLTSQKSLSGGVDYYFRHYDNNGNPVGPPQFVLNNSGSKTIYQVSSNRCGQYALVYTQSATGPIMVREYAYDDVAFPDYQVSSSTGLSNENPWIGLSSGLAITAWTRYKPSGKDQLYARRLLTGAFITGTPPVTVCPGGSQSAVIGRPGIPGYTYAWSPTTHLSNPNVAQPTVTHPGGTISSSTTYTVTIGSPCCQRTESVVVNFKPQCSGAEQAQRTRIGLGEPASCTGQPAVALVRATPAQASAFLSGSW